MLFGESAGAFALFGRDWLLLGGIATLAFATIGVLASQSLSRLAGYSVLVSAGTLLAAIGTGQNVVMGGALFYLVSSTLTIGAFFLLIELVERLRDPGADVLAVTMEVYGDIDEDDLDEEQEVGIAIPATIAILGGSFVGCALLLAGLPPLSGFVAKFAMLAGMLNSGPASMPDIGIAPSAWVLAALLLLSGLAALIALTRSGITTFWARMETAIPRVRLIEVLPIATLLLFCLGLSILAGPAMRYMEATVQALQNPPIYAHSVLGVPPVPEPKGEGAL